MPNKLKPNFAVGKQKRTLVGNIVLILDVSSEAADMTVQKTRNDVW